MIQTKKVLAFVHIEKAAGQTFTRILENNYIYKHCRVAPLKKEHQGVFTADAMKTIIRINPFVEAISGHSVRPSSDLESLVPKVRYVTLMRDPVKRYISHYQYWVQVFKKNISFEEFLTLESVYNFQTRKIAGSADVIKAKKILKEKVFLVGVVEEFDDFLKVLKAKMAPKDFDCSYKRKNVAKANYIKDRINKNWERYRARVFENNVLDIQLYDFAKNELFQSEKIAALQSSKGVYQDINANGNFQIKPDLVGRLYRNLYFGPIINIIRYRNGLKMGGSY